MRVWFTGLSFASASILVLIMGLFGFQSPSHPAYRNPNLSVDERVSDLLKRMTLEEKVAQLTCLWPRGADIPPDALKNGIGQIARQQEHKGPRGSAEFANSIQKYLVEHTRLGIPAIFHDEILHGHMAQGSTSFPQPIALASSWDLDLVNKVFTAGALEARSRGGQQVLGPNLDLGRDPRWGRTEETYGEDPYLVSRMAVAVIKALQGHGPTVDNQHVIATAKHFAAHGQPEAGTNVGPANFSERTLRETFFTSFEAAVKEAGVMSVMASYNEIDGVPSHMNKWLLDKVLRQEWGFKGHVVADYYAIPQLQDLHHVAANKSEAAKLALEAGVDIELPEPDAYTHLVDLVKARQISEATIDRAVARNLRAKFLLGLFENPYVDVNHAVALTNSAAHQALAAEAARRSIVLLKNENNLLPLDRSKIKTLAVIGPNAATLHLGGYSDNPGRGVSVLQGVKDKAGTGVNVVYAEGCKITKEGGNWFADTSTPADEAEDRKLIAAAVDTAQSADVALLVVGGNEDTNKEAWASNHLGDRDSLELFGRQNDLVRAVLATGKPVVVMLINGGPLSINYVAENVPAILEGFYLGQETGTAVADVLFGDYNPAGKLPISFPRSVGQLPIYYNQKPSGRRGYLFADKSPLFPFGYGLSYTTFSYGKPSISPARIAPNGQATVSIAVTNTGKRAGDEIVELYIHDLVSSVTRPVIELKDFRRISLQPGETKTVDFTITPDKLWFYDINMKRVVEPGTFEIMVGPSSVNHQSVTLEVQ